MGWVQALDVSVGPENEENGTENLVTIFGFNTDIRYGDTVYHVQTEAREAELLLQSAVFVRGRCIGKHGLSYADELASPDFSDDHVHALLTRQHRFIVNSIREGKIEAILGQAEPAKPQPMAPAADMVNPSGDSHFRPASPPSATEAPALQLEWLNSQFACTGSHVRLCFRAKRHDCIVEGVQIIGRLELEDGNPAYARSGSGSDGLAELVFELDSPCQLTADTLTVLVQATHEGECLRRKFRLRRSARE